MAKPAPRLTTSAEEPRKRRTREHVIADLSVNYVERLILECGHACERRRVDYGYDLSLYTFSPLGDVEQGELSIQLKATDHIERYELQQENCYSFPILIEDYRLWASAVSPVFLVLYDAVRRRAYWVYVQSYFGSHPVVGTPGQSVRVRIPQRQALTKRTIEYMRDRKLNIFRQSQGIIQHHD